ncbi:MAG: DUF5309 family protein [Rikenellaceae bacterium]
MNKKTKFFFIYGTAFVVALIATLAGYCDASDVIVAFAITGIPVTSTVTVSDAESYAPELNREDISSSVTMMMPSRTPLDTILRNLKRSKKTTAQKIGYYQASYKPIIDTFDTTATGDGSSSGSPASSYTYSEGSGVTTMFIKVSNPDIWRNHDTFVLRNLTLPGTTTSSSVGALLNFTDDVMFFVLSKSGSVLEVTPIGGVKGKASSVNSDKYVMPDFASTDELVRMGQAKSELAISTDPFAIYPEINWQYCQNFMAQIEESTFHRLTKKDVTWGFSNFEMVNILSMKMEMELSMLFGQGGEYVSGNDHTYFTRGITRDIEKVIEYGTSSGDRTISKDDYNSWLKEVFDGNNGSSSRVLFAGSGLIKSLSTIDEFDKTLSNVSKDATLGVDIRKINTYFGTLDIVLAPLFREAGWEDYGLILDLEHVVKHEFVPMSITDLDLKRSGLKNADAKVIQEVSALTLCYPDCHCIIKPKA